LAERLARGVQCIGGVCNDNNPRRDTMTNHTDWELVLTLTRNCGELAASASAVPVPEWNGEPVLPGDWAVIETALTCNASSLDAVATQEIYDAWLEGYEMERTRINSDAVTERAGRMSEDDARQILDAPSSLGGWWADFVDPSGDSADCVDADELADEAWGSFADLRDLAEDPDSGVDEIDVRAALRIAADAYIEMGEAQ
jgi:hypothetical protein